MAAAPQSPTDTTQLDGLAVVMDTHDNVINGAEEAESQSKDDA
jgi:hypothetical protein